MRGTTGRLGLAVLMLGLADAMAKSYFVLFTVGTVGATPAQAGLLATLTGAAGIVVSSWWARRYDRHPARRYAVAACVLGAAGYALLATTPSFAGLVALSVTLLAAVQAAFPQLFAAAHSDASTAGRPIAVLRSVWSLAWAVGPLVGAVIVTWRGYGALFTAAAVALLAAAAFAATTRRPTTPVESRTNAASSLVALRGRSFWFRVVGCVVLFHLAMFSGSFVLPLFITDELAQPPSAVGVMFSVCAAVEIAAALALARVPDRISARSLLCGGLATFVVFFVMAAAASRLAWLLVAQVPRGVAIAVVGAVGIRFFQEAFAPFTARATTLFANAVTVGLLLSGVLAGVVVENLGYRAALLACAGIALLATLLFASVPTSRTDSEPARGMVADDPHARTAPPES
ncbi:MFS transporter [Cellulomonas sp. URHD0024]|uniref:MFS transporter n=1 Tax=Cellulomonas sp. URHD0024 TaxID=1302620 RepID=UPI0018C926A4|nr:MFS transporter [Cellulomonas sp. URHD0024]